MIARIGCEFRSGLSLAMFGDQRNRPMFEHSPGASGVGLQARNNLR
jgi:hypothetical protein